MKSNNFFIGRCFHKDSSFGVIAAVIISIIVLLLFFP